VSAESLGAERRLEKLDAVMPAQMMVGVSLHINLSMVKRESLDCNRGSRRH
jgi:hypothetical protein